MPIQSLYANVPIPNHSLWEFQMSSPGRQLLKFKNSALSLDINTKATLTYKEHFELARAFGGGLISRWNWEKGDVLAFYGANDLYTGTISAGVHFAGGVVTHIDTTLSSSEVSWLLKDSSAKALICSTSLLEKAESSAKDAGLDADRIVTYEDTENSWRKLCVEDSPVSPVPVDPKTDAAYIVYTSGTSGRPKGVLISHTALIAQVLGSTILSAPFINKNECTIALPYTTIGGIVVREHCFYNGIFSIVTTDFSLPTLAGLIQEYEVTYTFLPPIAIAGIIKSEIYKKYDLSSLLYIGTLGLTWPREMADSLWEKTGIRVRNMYGITEHCGTVAAPMVVECRSTIGTAGHLCPFVEAKVISPTTGEEILDSTPGRFFIKSPCLMLGYLNKPSKTAAAFDSDGFFDTGDIISMTDKALVTVLGRASDQICFRGIEYMVSKLEPVIKSHAKVVDCAVIAVDGMDGRNSDPMAFVVLGDQESIDEKDSACKDFAEFVASRVDEARQLRGGVVAVSEIPRSAVGKMKKAVLLAMVDLKVKRL